MARYFRVLIAAGLLAAAGSTAQADTMVKFYNDGSGYSGPFNGAGTVYNALSNPGTLRAGCGAGSTTCTPTSGNDIISSTVVFTGTGAGITASSAGSVWWDLSPPYGGLGVGTGSGTANSADDQINLGEILRIHFASTVTLTGVATLFDSAHATFGTNYAASTVPNKDLLICIVASCSTPSGANTFTFGAANTKGGLSLTGTDFYFAVDGNTGQGIDYYVSGLTYRAVPGPLAGAGLPGLIFASGGVLAWWRRRKQATRDAGCAATA
jgi:hypothetical protein